MLIYLTDIKQMPKWEKIYGSLEDVFDYDPDKISINELLKKQAQYEFLKSYNLSPEDIKKIYYGEKVFNNSIILKILKNFN